jgi:hypothetical protein
MLPAVSLPIPENKPARRKIPAYLVRETIDGIPFYYAGYKDVMLLEGINMNIGNYLNTKGIYIAGLDG